MAPPVVIRFVTLVAAVFVSTTVFDYRFAWAESAVDFVQDVVPIFKAHCCVCHGEAFREADLDLSSAAGIRQGSESGQILDADNPRDSRLLEVIQHGEMPPAGEGEPLSDQQIKIIRRWIDGGAHFGTEQTDESLALNQHDILPIVLLRCSTCHGRQTQQGGLDLRTKASMLAGGKSGPAFVPGDPTASLMIQKIVAEEMPPRPELASHSVKPVTPHELELLSEWIASGATEVELMPDAPSTEPDPLVSDEDRQFWAFQPPQEVKPPTVDDADLIRNPIDAFVLRKIKEAGLELAPQASDAVLLRRIFFDLTGLPPSPDEIKSFLADTDPAAYDRWIDFLLESPRYGERWGQYWLDLAGYSDSEGVQDSDPIRPHAWRYRDYVIRSFNANKPYDRFLLEQIAGDELLDYENAAEITGELYDNLVATGFLRMTSDGTFSGITGFVPNRLDVIDDQLRVLSSSVMGLTIRCARCHSHKFDPIPQRDYYRLVALFKPAMDEHDWLKPVSGGAGNVMGSFRYLSVAKAEEKRAWEAKDEQLRVEIEALQAQLADRPDDEEFKKVTAKNIKELEDKRDPQPMIRALWDRGEPSPTYLLRRGDYRQPGRLVGPGVPSVLTDGRTPFAREIPWPSANKTGNRLALARWLTQPDHPLTARVLVNRLWRHHFGRGIVETLDDFGRAGAPASHEELLDWLAVEFVRSSWDINHMHRLMMTSATYRRSSETTDRQRRLDPNNRLLSHMPLRRMEAEVLRDSLLAVAGQLDLTPFGPPDDIDVRDDGLVVALAKASGQRRSIYIEKRRSQRLTILDNFDRPAMSPNCVDRTESIVAPQALQLMNNKTVYELSLALADRILLERGEEDHDRIDQLFLVTVGRAPIDDERQTLLEVLERIREKWLRHEVSSPQVEKRVELERKSTRRAYQTICHAVLSSAAFLYID